MVVMSSFLPFNVAPPLIKQKPNQVLQENYHIVPENDIVIMIMTTDDDNERGKHI